MELKFSYNKTTRCLESDDAGIFVESRGGVETHRSFVLHWHGRKMPFSANFEEATNSEGITEVRWTISYILSTNKAEMYDYKSISEAREAVGLMKSALAYFDGWANGSPFKVMSVGLTPMIEKTIRGEY